MERWAITDSSSTFALAPALECSCSCRYLASGSSWANAERLPMTVLQDSCKNIKNLLIDIGFLHCLLCHCARLVGVLMPLFAFMAVQLFHFSPPLKINALRWVRWRQTVCEFSHDIQDLQPRLGELRAEQREGEVLTSAAGKRLRSWVAPFDSLVPSIRCSKLHRQENLIVYQDLSCA